MLWNWHRSRALSRDLAHSWVLGPHAQAKSTDRHFATLAELTRMVAECRETDRVIDRLTTCVAEGLQVKTVGVATWDKAAHGLLFRGGCGWSPDFRAGRKIAMRPDWSAYRRFVFGRPLVIEDLLHENRFKAPRALLAQGAISGLVAPLLCVTRPSGLIAAFSTDQRKFSPTDVAFFKAAANLLNAVLENDRLRSQLQLSATSVRRETTRKTSFVANASHEIRSPLNVILGYCEIIGECLRDTGDTNVTAWMEAVERAGTRLLATVDDILDYSRIEAGTVPLAVESLRLAPLVQAVARAAAPAAIAKRIGLSCAIDAPDAVVRGDRRCLTVALTKLVANAIKFTARGAVEIGLKRDRRGRVILEIRDTGVGIAADYIPRLFEPFSQEVADYARPFEGIGLGLAIARHYLQLNHAHISARSEKGRGSVFTVRLPVVAAKLSGKPSGPPMRLCQTRPQPLISGCTSR